MEAATMERSVTRAGAENDPDQEYDHEGNPVGAGGEPEGQEPEPADDGDGAEGGGSEPPTTEDEPPEPSGRGGIDSSGQTAMDEREVDDAELAKMLRDREVAKGKAGEARKKYRTLDELAKGRLAELGLEDGDVIRIEEFRVKVAAVPSRSVSFETEPTTRLSIGVAD